MRGWALGSALLLAACQPRVAEPGRSPNLVIAPAPEQPAAPSATPRIDRAPSVLGRHVAEWHRERIERRLLLQPLRLPLVRVGPREQLDCASAAAALQPNCRVLDHDGVPDRRQVLPSADRQLHVNVGADPQALRAPRCTATLHHEHEARVAGHVVASDRSDLPPVRRLPSLSDHHPPRWCGVDGSARFRPGMLMQPTSRDHAARLSAKSEKTLQLRAAASPRTPDRQHNQLVAVDAEIDVSSRLL